MTAAKELLADVQAVRPSKQCPATYVTMRGKNLSAVFCEHRAEHEGPHKGSRKRWTGTGLANDGAHLVTKGVG